jgi:cytoskeletal protein CcmA (bactofilin family)
MSSDLPDYTLPINIKSLSIASIPITVIGSITIPISGTVSISGTVTVSGTVSISGTVTISGTVSISGSVTITGAVTITSGNITFTNTTIAVTGTVSISGTVTVSGAVTVTGTVSISGTVTVSGAVTVTGTVSISGTVTVSGSVTVSGTVAISGTVVISGAVTVTGTVTISNASLTVTGNVTINSQNAVVQSQTSQNLIKNGNFSTGTFDGWDIVANSIVDPTVKLGNSITAKLTAQTAYIQQVLTPIVAARLIINFYAISSLGHASNLLVTLTFQGGGSETLTVTVPSTGILKQYQFTTANRPQTIKFTNQDATDVVWLTDILALALYDDLQGNFEVLPKAKRVTTIVADNVVTSTGSATIHTVTAGTVFYLSRSWIASIAFSTGQTTSTYVEVDTAGNGTFRKLATVMLATSTLINATSGNMSASESVPMPFPAASVFRVTTETTSIYSRGGIVGWEE